MITSHWKVAQANGIRISGRATENRSDMSHTTIIVWPPLAIAER
jgi:hypothetical protein